MTRTFVKIISVILVLVGLLGFINDPILGIFETDTVHNIVHLLTGIIGLWAATKGEGAAKTFSKVFGVIYALVAILGLIMGGDKVIGLMAVNGADHVLHIILAVLFLWFGFKKDSMPAAM